MVTFVLLPILTGEGGGEEGGRCPLLKMVWVMAAYDSGISSLKALSHEYHE